MFRNEVGVATTCENKLMQCLKATYAKTNIENLCLIITQCEKNKPRQFGKQNIDISQEWFEDLRIKHSCEGTIPEVPKERIFMFNCADGVGGPKTTK